jgi:hypothetical protein
MTSGRQRRALGLLFLASACGGTQPHWQTVTRDHPEALLSIAGSSAQDVWTVGADQGTGPAVWHFDGSAWERKNTGTSGDLWWVHVFADGTAFLGGANATVLRAQGERVDRLRTPGVARHTVYGLWGRAPDDLWAVGSVAGRDGFAWRFDGAAWTDVPLPEDLPRSRSGDSPGLFKVCGAGDTVWLVGGAGLVLRSVKGGPLEVVASGVSDTLFTVHAAGTNVLIVGGASSGVLLEWDGRAFQRRTPDGASMLQGVFVRPDASAVASGERGELYERFPSGLWRPLTGADASQVESLHAAWLDPSGGIWSVGGDVLSGSLKSGQLVHRGPSVPEFSAPLVQTPPISGQCPAQDVDPTPQGSIARRWNEQILSAIRRDVPRPGVHARNLYHLSVALYDAWAVYDATAGGVVVTEKLPAPSDLGQARTEALSYAAYRVLQHRYSRALGGSISSSCFDALFRKLGFDPADARSDGVTPRALGNRVGAAVIARFAQDGANEANNYADTTGFVAANPSLRVDDTSIELPDPARWQPLDLAMAVTQNGIPLGPGPQGYIGAQWGQVLPFALSRSTPDAPYFSPALPDPGFGPQTRAWVLDVLRKSSRLDLGSGEVVDISPGALGNNPLGTNDGRGHPVNPVTGAPYPPQPVPAADFGRVLAEFWADGPASETPPGHWNVIANSVSDHALLSHRLFGTGPVLPRLEWDVKLYLTINGAVHDAAIAAWEQKRLVASSRPISLIRYMASRGQCSDRRLPRYDAEGLPLEPGLVELITRESSAPGERHAHLRPFIGQIAVRSWRGEPGDRARDTGGVAWIRAADWMPYQRRTFVTPAFPGFVSGHSTFSRAAAEVLTALTNSSAFPGGLGESVAPRDVGLGFERGPSAEVRLQWGTYYDASDQAGQSRIWGGIHIEPDDFYGRRIGHEVGLAAVQRARSYFAGR